MYQRSDILCAVEIKIIFHSYPKSSHSFKKTDLSLRIKVPIAGQWFFGALLSLNLKSLNFAAQNFSGGVTHTKFRK